MREIFSGEHYQLPWSRSVSIKRKPVKHKFAWIISNSDASGHPYRVSAKLVERWWHKLFRIKPKDYDFMWQADLKKWVRAYPNPQNPLDWSVHFPVSEKELAILQDILHEQSRAFDE